MTQSLCKEEFQEDVRLRERNYYQARPFGEGEGCHNLTFDITSFQGYEYDDGSYDDWCLTLGFKGKGQL